MSGEENWRYIRQEICCKRCNEKKMQRQLITTVMQYTWKFVSLGDAREEEVDPSVVCPEVDPEPFSVNLE